MSSKSKEILPEQKQMLNVCWTEKSNKATMELISYICSAVRSSKGSKQAYQKVITVFVSQPSGKVRNTSVISGQLLMNCLIYCMFKYRNLSVEFHPSSLEQTKIKKKKFALIEASSNVCLNINQAFSTNILKFLETEHKISEISVLSIQEIDLKCVSSGSPSIDAKTKRHILSFIQYFYKNINFISSNNNLYVVKHNLELFSDDNRLEKRQIQIASNNNTDEDQQKIIRGNILKLLGLFYINYFLIKDDSCDIRQMLLADKPVAQKDLIISKLDMGSNSISPIDYGYFGKFYGNNFEYLSKIYISFSEDFNVEAVAGVLKALPNLSSMRLRKRGNQIIVPDINLIIEALIQYNKLIQQFWLKNIKVTQEITLEMLQKLYEQCPYLVEMELQMPPQIDHEKKNLLNAFRLRKISLSNNLQMSKLLINRKYNFNSIIQIIDCIEPICF